MNGFVIRDTHRLIGKLQQRGFSAQQAEGITDAIKEIDASELATKADIKDLQLQLYKFLTGVLIAHGLSTAALTVALLELLK